MASTVRSHRADAGLWKMLAVGILALLAFIWWDTYSAAGAPAALEHQRNVEMAPESRAVCEKWGMSMPAGTKKYDACVADIDAVRGHHEKRVMEDFGFLGTLQLPDGLSGRRCANLREARASRCARVHPSASGT
jgi:hypothetical protein